MIYQYYIINYFFSFVITIVSLFRLRTYLKNFFDQNFADLLTFLILFHPLSVDAVMAPNLIAGGLAFLFLIEGLIRLEKLHLSWSLLLFTIASICNISYGLFPIYIFYKNKKSLQHLLPYFIFYSFLFIAYYGVHLLTSPRNPFIFFTYFLQNLLLPLAPNIINYGFFPFAKIPFLLTAMFLGFFYWKQKTNSKLKEFLPFIIFPLIGVVVFPWTETYQEWHEVIYAPSSFLSITFGVVMICAFCLPQKFFRLYFVAIFLLSIYWILYWFPHSRIIESSLNNLPKDFAGELPKIHNFLDKQYLYESNSH